uniref:tRNA uridine(34) hydroxylase N-terminal domain-containing protein n=1 Tax=Fagus sylvatica TaxID=28930 RepID=A0A2N9GYW8_FAGSY
MKRKSQSLQLKVAVDDKYAEYITCHLYFLLFILPLAHSSNLVYCILFFVPHQADAFQHVSGGIILAPEGINGSICGTRESVERVLGFIQTDSRLKGLRQVESPVSPEEEAIHHGHLPLLLLLQGKMHPSDGIMSGSS